jgi:hypothetical protein
MVCVKSESGRVASFWVVRRSYAAHCSHRFVRGSDHRLYPALRLGHWSQAMNKSARGTFSQNASPALCSRGNQCANPRCATVLINADGTLVADVCHIKAERPGGPRFDKTLMTEQRRAPKTSVGLSDRKAGADPRPKQPRRSGYGWGATLTDRSTRESGLVDAEGLSKGERKDASRFDL